jgi:tetratricopeptide (TPR) repeat protein
MVIGTPSFMSPEQAQGRIGELGPATDVYSLGAALYTVLVGLPPFRAPSVMETFHQILDSEPLPPRQLVPSVPRDLETICLKALAKRPVDRYSSASAMAEDLRRFLDGSPIHARALRAPEHLVRWVRRRRALSGMIFLAAVVLSCAVYQQYAFRDARNPFSVDGGRELRRRINHAAEVDLIRDVERGEARIRNQKESGEARRMLASTYHRQGDLFVNTDRLAYAIAAYDRAILLLCRDSGDEPSHVASRVELAEVLSNLGEAFWALGQKTDARAAYTQALRVNERLVLEHPELSACRDRIARTRERLNQLTLGASTRSTGPSDESPRR